MGKWMTDKESLHCIRWYKVIPNGAKDQWWKRPHLSSVYLFSWSSFLPGCLFCICTFQTLGHHERPIPVGLPRPLPHATPYTTPAIPSGFAMLTKYREVAKVGRSKWGAGHRVHRQSLTCHLCCSSFMWLMYITREVVESMGIFICTCVYICICIFCQRVVKTWSHLKPWVSPPWFSLTSSHSFPQ